MSQCRSANRPITDPVTRQKITWNLVPNLWAKNAPEPPVIEDGCEDGSQTSESYFTREEQREIVASDGESAGHVERGVAVDADGSVAGDESVSAHSSVSSTVLSSISSVTIALARPQFEPALHHVLANHAMITAPILIANAVVGAVYNMFFRPQIRLDRELHEEEIEMVFDPVDIERNPDNFRRHYAREFPPPPPAEGHEDDPPPLPPYDPHGLPDDLIIDPRALGFRRRAVLFYSYRAPSYVGTWLASIFGGVAPRSWYDRNLFDEESFGAHDLQLSPLNDNFNTVDLSPLQTNGMRAIISDFVLRLFRDALSPSVASPNDTYLRAYITQQGFTHYKVVEIYPALLDDTMNNYGASSITTGLQRTVLHYMQNVPGRRGLDSSTVIATAMVLTQRIAYMRYIGGYTYRETNTPPARQLF
jgi:hypothetical protein